MNTETEAETEGTGRLFSSVASSASVELTTQTSKCEPVMTEAQAETKGWTVSVSASVASANQAWASVAFVANFYQLKHLI